MIKHTLKDLFWFWLVIAAILLMTAGCERQEPAPKIIVVQPVIIVPHAQPLNRYQAHVELL